MAKGIADTGLINDANLQAYYKFHTDGNDTTANNYHLTGENTPTFVVGKIGNGVHFTAASSQDYLRTAAIANLIITGDMSMCCWIKPDSIGSTMTIIWIGGEGSDETEAGNVLFQLRVDTDGKLTYVHEYSTGSNESHQTSSVYIAAGNWYHLAAVRDVSENEVYIYVNGGLKETLSYSNDPTGGTGSELCVGAVYDNPQSNFFDGIIDDLAIFDRVLTPSEIKSLYKGGSGGVILV